MTSSNGNIFCVTGPLGGEFTGPRWIPRTKASDADLWCFLWSFDWINNGEAGDLRRYRAHYDVIVMVLAFTCCQPHRMGYGQYPTFKMDGWVDGWMDILWWQRLSCVVTVDTFRSHIKCVWEAWSSVVQTMSLKQVNRQTHPTKQMLQRSPVRVKYEQLVVFLPSDVNVTCVFTVVICPELQCHCYKSEGICGETDQSRIISTEFLDLSWEFGPFLWVFLLNKEFLVLDFKVSSMFSYCHCCALCTIGLWLTVL